MDEGRSLVGYSPQGHVESETTERLHFLFSLSCFEEGNGNPLQCSGLENPRDRGAWWAAVYGVAQSRTRLKRLSSSSYPSPAPPARQSLICFLSLQWFFFFFHNFIHIDSQNGPFFVLLLLYRVIIWGMISEVSIVTEVQSYFIVE